MRVENGLVMFVRLIGVMCAPVTAVFIAAFGMWASWQWAVIPFEANWSVPDQW